MKLEKLNINEIKVTLSKEDILEWNLTIDKLTYNSPEAQDLFFELLRRAEDELKFKAQGRSLLVKAIISGKQDFVMHIIRTGATKPNSNLTTVKLPNKLNKMSIKPNCTIFLFENFEDLVNGCKRIENILKSESKCYKYENKYYLYLKSVAQIAENIKIPLLDYGSLQEKPMSLLGILQEYGEVLIKTQAVSTLSKYFK